MNPLEIVVVSLIAGAVVLPIMALTLLAAVASTYNRRQRGIR